MQLYERTVNILPKQTMEIEIALGALILIALVFLATVDMAFSHLSDISLRRLSAESEESHHHRSALFLKEILENRPRFRFAVSLGIQFLLISFAVVVTIAVLKFTTDLTYVALEALAVALIATAIFRQVIPRLITRNDPEAKLLFLLPAVRPLYLLTSFLGRPFTRLFRSAKQQQKIETSAAPDASDERSDEGMFGNNEDLQAFMEVGTAEGIIEDRDREMIESMVEFSETRTGEIMTPRTEIVGLPSGSTIRAARDLIIEQKYSRLPVYRDSIDNIEGVIYVRDLMQAWALGKENELIDDILRPAYFVPETKSAADLLKTMQFEHVQIAIVIDEYGGVAGIVSLEDIVEEIVGEIEDEDIEEQEIIEIVENQDGYWDVLGSTEIDKIERIFDLDLEDDDYTTIAGMITSVAGHIPKTGDVIDINGISAEILEADEKKVHQVRLRSAESTAAAFNAERSETT